MTRFERANGGSDAWTGDDNLFPDDFSCEEAAFASDLRELFSPEREVVPPLFTQTLLGDPRHVHADSAFERRLMHRVRRRLELPAAPLFDRRGRWRLALHDPRPRVSRPIAASLSAVVLLMMLTLLLASPSFAAGMQLIFGHTGALQVHNYPTHVASASTTMHPAKPLNLRAPARIDWLGQSLGNYQFSQLLQSEPQTWSDGPVVDLRYQLSSKAHDGSGLLDIREFRTAPDLAYVLQVVADGSAVPVTVDGAPAAYVDGRWVHYGRHQVWQDGIKSELIFEKDGLVFWIVGDQRDGMTQDQLLDVAQHLTSIATTQLTSPMPSLRLIGEQLVGSVANPTDGEVLALVPVGSNEASTDIAFVALSGGSLNDMS